MAQGYNRWLCERIISLEPRLISMLYLPFNDPEAAFGPPRNSPTARAWSGSW
jgi:hypothetical protein